jgi:hypothetical protein
MRTCLNIVMSSHCHFVVAVRPRTVRCVVWGASWSVRLSRCDVKLENTGNAQYAALHCVRITLILREMKPVCQGNRAHWPIFFFFFAKNVKQTKYGTLPPSADWRHVTHIVHVSLCRRLAAPSCYAADRARNTGRHSKRTSLPEFSFSQRAVCDRPTVLAYNFLELLRRLTGSTCVQRDQIFATTKWTVRSELRCFYTL